jgi:hypothetical protein
MPELIITLQAKNRKELEDRKFLASLQGVDLEESQETTSFDDVRRRALGINASADDVVSLQGTFANEAGFGIGAGLGYRRE